MTSRAGRAMAQGARRAPSCAWFELSWKAPLCPRESGSRIYARGGESYTRWIFGGRERGSESVHGMGVPAGARAPALCSLSRSTRRNRPVACTRLRLSPRRADGMLAWSQSRGRLSAKLDGSAVPALKLALSGMHPSHPARGVRALPSTETGRVRICDTGRNFVLRLESEKPSLRLRIF